MAETAERIVWITGASSGLGAAAARAYAADGWRVAATARGASALEALGRETGGRVRAFPADGTDRVAMAATVARIEATMGPIDLAILNAGAAEYTEVAAFDPAVFDRLFAVNVIGTVNALTPLLPGMLARRAGVIAIVASIAGYRGLPRASAYGATKAALINMAEALKVELDGTGVSMKLVNPGFVRTPLTDKNDFPMPFLMEVDAAAAAMKRGLAGSGFEVVFPRRMAWLLKFLRVLPYALYFAAVSRVKRR